MRSPPMTLCTVPKGSQRLGTAPIRESKGNERVPKDIGFLLAYSWGRMKQIQSVTVRTDDEEEVRAMHFLIQRWVMNGWRVKNISQFSRSESYFGGLSMQISSYSTIIFEKDDSPFCPICNISVNDMNLHRSWHLKKEKEQRAAPSIA